MHEHAVFKKLKVIKFWPFLPRHRWKPIVQTPICMLQAMWAAESNRKRMRLKWRYSSRCILFWRHHTLPYWFSILLREQSMRKSQDMLQPQSEVIGTPSDFVQNFHVAWLGMSSILPEFDLPCAEVGRGWQTVSGPDNSVSINPYWERSDLLRIDQTLWCTCAFCTVVQQKFSQDRVGWLVSSDTQTRASGIWPIDLHDCCRWRDGQLETRRQVIKSIHQRPEGVFSLLEDNLQIPVEPSPTSVWKMFKGLGVPMISPSTGQEISKVSTSSCGQCFWLAKSKNLRLLLLKFSRPTSDASAWLQTCWKLHVLC